MLGLSCISAVSAGKMSVRWKIQKYKIMNLVAEFVPLHAKMRDCFPSLVKLGKKRQIIHFQHYKLISFKFSNTSVSISELRVLLRKHLGKKKVWQHLSFLGSARYEKCGANAHSVSVQNYSPPNIAGQSL